MLGVDHFITAATQKNLHLGLLTNHACLTSSGLPVAFDLLKNDFPIKKIFSPEHGVYSQAEDGAMQSNQIDSLTKLPVVSLYGEKLAPTAEDLIDVDAVLIDLPNIGTRFYTYWWTITHMLEVCGVHHKKVILLDRPNMRGATSSIEGPILDEQNCSTFLGRWPMPLTFNCTYGALAKWFNHQRKLNVDLHIISSTSSEEKHFIPPSPAINEKQTAFIYPCTGIFEGVNVSVGRGTTFPFRVIGAPWINPTKFLEFFHDYRPEGIKAFMHSFKPMWSDYANQFCYGLYFTVTDPTNFKPVSCALELMRFLMTEYPAHFTSARYPTAANPSGENHLDRLLGVPHSFQQIKTNFNNLNLLTHDQEVQRWQREVEDCAKGTSE